MPKVLCTLPNASEEISGVKFATHANGMLSEDVSDDVAANFAAIPGYEIVGAPAPAVTQKSDDQADAERAALIARAEAVGLSVKGNWGLVRLASEVDAAEKAAAEAAGAQGDKTE